jgi:hypothetical protein
LSAASPLAQLLAVFSLLGLAPPASLRSVAIADAWAWAMAQWSTQKVPRRLNLRVND